MKAQVRDTNLQASRKMLLADGSGKVYQKAPTSEAITGREAKVGHEAKPVTAACALKQRGGEPAKVAPNRTTPAAANGVPRDNRKAVAKAAGPAKGTTAAQAIKRADRVTAGVAAGARIEARIAARAVARTVDPTDATSGVRRPRVAA